MVSLTLIILALAIVGFIAVGGIEKSQDLFTQGKESTKSIRKKLKGNRE